MLFHVLEFGLLIAGFSIVVYEVRKNGGITIQGIESDAKAAEAVVVSDVAKVEADIKAKV